jgi:hypothetical protein
MARVFFRNRPGARAVRGGLIIDVQKALVQAGVMPPSVDGVFGQQTKSAVRLWQASKGLPATGEIDELTWVGLMGSQKPSLFRRCIALTAAFEGHGYTLAAGNWDNALITWGIIGFTMAGGNLQKVIRGIDERYPSVLAEAMGAQKAADLLAAFKKPKAQQTAWANSISLPPKKYRLLADWEDAFEALGHRPEARAVQDEVARSVYWTVAVKDLNKYGRRTEADAALFFDTSVQNGGVNGPKGEAIKKALQENPNASDRTRLSLIADAIADNSNPTFKEDVRSRRQAIAKGRGVVHGATYQVDDWGLDILPISDADLTG